jgi:hypothetical protein
MLMTTQNSVSHMAYLLQARFQNAGSLAGPTHEGGLRSRLFLKDGIPGKTAGFGRV